MDTANADEVSDVLDRVRLWAPSSRITLARRILESLDSTAAAGGQAGLMGERPTSGVPVEEVVGLLRTDREPPSDEECRRIVEEERWRKYGPLMS